MKSKYWMILLAAVLLLCAGLSVWLLSPGEQAGWAEIWSDGQLIETVHFGADRVLTVESKHGINVISVRDGKIGVVEADCPAHYCMERGLCNRGAQIVCLPNRLVIRFVGEQELDGIVG
ncbi:MAG: NusG domain II-containing protein [Oscillospiraceae bacterium]|nr:NusG domain II-containing protein [Oscillospiraceae bacterium]